MHIVHRIALLFLGVVAILATLGYYLAPQDELQKVDAIVAISGDQGERLESAVRLYEQGWATTIVFSGAAQDPLSPSNAAIMRRSALTAGVPKSAIILEEESLNTRENARNVTELLQANSYDSIILVTSPYHQRRASLEFSWANPDIRVVNYSAKDENWRRSQWWITPRGWYLTVSESMKIALTSVQNYAGRH